MGCATQPNYSCNKQNIKKKAEVSLSVMEAASFSINTEDEHEVPLSVQFRGKEIPVSWSAAVTRDEAVQGVASEPFLTWLHRCTNAAGTTTTTTTTTKQLCVHHIEIQSVDMFGPRLVFLFCY